MGVKVRNPDSIRIPLSSSKDGRDVWITLFVIPGATKTDVILSDYARKKLGIPWPRDKEQDETIGQHQDGRDYADRPHERRDTATGATGRLCDSRDIAAGTVCRQFNGRDSCEDYKSSLYQEK